VKKKKDKDFRFTFKHFLRLLAFIFIVYYLFTYLSSSLEKRSYNSSDPTVLGQSSQAVEIPQIFDNLYQSLPKDTKDKIEAIPSLPVIIKAQEGLSSLQKEMNGFPQKQINQLKKELIRSVADDMINKIDQE